MLAIPIYDRAGQQVGEESIDPADFGGAVNRQLLHDVVRMHRANRRVGTVNTRGRSDVAGSGKKLFRQKGTGNARAGSKRTNKRKGGGVAFARRNRDYSYEMPKKAVRTAVRMALLSKFESGQAIVVDGLAAAGATPKTKEVAKVLSVLPRPDLDRLTPEDAAARAEHARRSGRLGARKKRLLDEAEAGNQAAVGTKAAARRRALYRQSVLIGIPDPDSVFHRSARNIEGVSVAPVAEFNTYDILRRKYLVLTREALAALKERAGQPVARRRPQQDAAAAAPES